MKEDKDAQPLVTAKEPPAEEEPPSRRKSTSAPPRWPVPYLNSMSSSTPNNPISLLRPLSG